MEEKDLTYLAALMDGEGHFGIQKIKKDNYSFFSDKLRIKMRTKGCLSWTHKTFGGTLKEYDEKGRPMYEWAVYTKECRKICKMLLPYLKEKKRQAEIILELSTYIAKKGDKKTDPNRTKNKERLCSELKKLHH